MATLNQNGINFTLNAESVTTFTGKYTDIENFDDSTRRYNVDQNKLNTLGVSMSFNAVEIDWNDAELGEVNGIPLGTIKTTGDLIKVIQG